MYHLQNIRVYNPHDVLPLIVYTNQYLLARSDAIECALMLATAATESAFICRQQIGGGPARGLWQMEPGMTGAQDIFENYLRYKPKRFQKLIRLWLNLDIEPFFVPSVGDLSYHLETNDVFACAMARLQYLRRPEPIPDTVNEMAHYWKEYYNTDAGAGTTARFIKAWDFHKCSELLRAQFPEHNL